MGFNSGFKGLMYLSMWGVLKAVTVIKS